MCATVVAGAEIPSLGPRGRRWLVPLTIVSLVAASIGAFYGDGGWWHPGDHTDQRLAGEWIAAHADPDTVVMTRSFVVAFYADTPTLAIPYADLDEVLQFGRHYGARYLVADSFHVGRLRPQLVELFGPRIPAGLRLVHEVRAEGRTTRIFALDPVPPPSDEVGPSLGFMGDG